MRRRDVIIGLASTASLAAFPARAQRSPAPRRIGVLIGLAESDAEGRKWAGALFKSLGEQGWTRDGNLQVDQRWGGADVAHIEAQAKEMVRLGPEVIAVSTTPGTAAVVATNTRIPVVFSAVSDPTPFVHNLARPDGNITGFVNFEESIGGKWVELLRETAPQLSQIVILFNATSATPQFTYYRGSIERAAAVYGMTVRTLSWNDTASLEQGLATLAGATGVGLIVMPTPHEVAQRDLIVAAANRMRIPTMYPFAFWVRQGGLVSYGVDLADLHRRAGFYIDRLLKGAQPGELPVQFPTKFEVAVNLKTANMLGITPPATLLGRADEVVE